MEVFLQACIGGLAQGCVYALVALGFVLIYKATEVANFAQGELMMVGAYIHFSLVVFGGLDPLLALPVTLVLAGLMGATVEPACTISLIDDAEGKVQTYLMTARDLNKTFEKASISILPFGEDTIARLEKEEGLADKVGLLEAANGGTVFLDEVSETSPGFQVKLLRALQEGEVTRVGDHTPRKIDVRVVAATNKDLELEIKEVTCYQEA